jgi:hypothetical protein
MLLVRVEERLQLELMNLAQGPSAPNQHFNVNRQIDLSVLALCLTRTPADLVCCCF